MDRRDEVTDTHGKLAKGYDCSECGKFNRYPSYVYAHWDDRLTHECECGAKHDIIRGRAYKQRRTKTKRG